MKGTDPVVKWAREQQLKYQKTHPVTLFATRKLTVQTSLLTILLSISQPNAVKAISDEGKAQVVQEMRKTEVI